MGLAACSFISFPNYSQLFHVLGSHIIFSIKKRVIPLFEKKILDSEESFGSLFGLITAQPLKTLGNAKWQTPSQTQTS